MNFTDALLYAAIGFVVAAALLFQVAHSHGDNLEPSTERGVFGAVGALLFAASGAFSLGLVLRLFF